VKKIPNFHWFTLTFLSNTCTIVGMSSSSAPAIEMALNEAVGRVNVAHAELVAVIVEVLDSGCWNGHGIRSPEHWVTWKAGVSATRARDLVLIAQRSLELPLTAEVFRNGLLSVDQVAAIARETPAEFDETVCELAKSSTVPQLQSVLRSYPWHKSAKPAKPDEPAEGSNDSDAQMRNGTEPEPAPTPDREPEDRVYTRHDENSRFHLHAELGSLEGAEIEAALNEARDALYRAGNHHVTWAQALLEVCRRSLNNTGSTSRTDNYRVYLHINGDHAWINGGPKLPASVRSRILCDSSVHPYLITGGKPINVGRVTRVIPAHTRRAVLDRDSTCRYPGCTTRKLEVHHLVHWEHGGPTNTENLAGLCSFHHHRHHDGTYTVSGNADLRNGLIFQRADGTTIIPGPQPIQPSGPLRAPPNPYKPPTGETLQRKWLTLAPARATSERTCTSRLKGVAAA
jgi:hypothetical protein